MRRTLRALLVVCAGALALGGKPVLAQAKDSSSAPAYTRWSDRPVGKYRLDVALPERVMEVDLTIAIRADTMVATFWPVGDNDGHEMSVTVKDTDLVLKAVTPRGPIEIVVRRSNDQLFGQWTMGPDKGTLRGQVQRSE